MARGLRNRPKPRVRPPRAAHSRRCRRHRPRLPRWRPLTRGANAAGRDPDTAAGAPARRPAVRCCRHCRPPAAHEPERDADADSDDVSDQCPAGATQARGSRVADSYPNSHAARRAALSYGHADADAAADHRLRPGLRPRTAGHEPLGAAVHAEPADNGLATSPTRAAVSQATPDDHQRHSLTHGQTQRGGCAGGDTRTGYGKRHRDAHQRGDTQRADPASTRWQLRPAFAVARLPATSGLTVTLSSPSSEEQPLDRDSITWYWSVVSQASGPRHLRLDLELRYKGRTADVPAVPDEPVWTPEIMLDVREKDAIVMGPLSIPTGNIGQTIISAGLSSQIPLLIAWVRTRVGPHPAPPPRRRIWLRRRSSTTAAEAPPQTAALTSRACQSRRPAYCHADYCGMRNT